MHFALMHCVAIYPTPNDKLGLNQINVLKERFPHVPIGFSTHEEPDNYASVQIAYAKGARLFERHVGMETEKHALNSYSSRPEQIARWIEAYKQALAACAESIAFPPRLMRSPLTFTHARSIRTRADQERR